MAPPKKLLLCPSCERWLSSAMFPRRNGARNCFECAEAGKNHAALVPPRRCHDCGKKTRNYRCAACLAKWRARHGVPDSAFQSSDAEAEIGLYSASGVGWLGELEVLR